MPLDPVSSATRCYVGTSCGHLVGLTCFPSKPKQAINNPQCVKGACALPLLCQAVNT